MKSRDIRQKFFDFFTSKGHKIVPSVPMVVKNDPTLMFTNAGMNQFKDYFLANKTAATKRIANTQKCLRVSGKHNDLEEVGHDTYHHTMFEMLGNWSFGDYFKKEAIKWAFELLTIEYGIPADKLYATYFGGDETEGLKADTESLEIWKNYLPGSHILSGSKKDNFWEMGETGPCGPCSEIHIDLRDKTEITKLSGRELVNKDHPEVIEIWNLVFIQFNRLADKSLENLPENHVDTGMGFERLCMVLQGKKSNYDTDVFTPLIEKCASITGFNYGESKEVDTAMRVVSDHLRAVAFSIADGQLPSNNKAGYVIRRILRRAIRYGYTFLNQKEAFIYKIFPTLSDTLGEQFPEIQKQADLITKVIKEEEENFLRTLDMGIRLLSKEIEKAVADKNKVISGKTAFILYDTYGFPIDLTELILRENNLLLNQDEFETELKIQKDRSRNASKTDKEDWVMLDYENQETRFIGYDSMESECKIVKYREVKEKSKSYFHLVLDKTPFYAESGGQTGDTGVLQNKEEEVFVENTIKENDLILHVVNKMPKEPGGLFVARVNASARRDTMRNHSATHLLHQALREILGTQVEQKGSLVEAERLRFDFAHFQKMTKDEVRAVEEFVNTKIIANIPLEEFRQISMKQAEELGAIALFGEKYGDQVRVIKFGDSIELCGGTHVAATGETGCFKIVSESAVAAGIRRIEAITGLAAFHRFQLQDDLLKSLFSNFSTDEKRLFSFIEKLVSENKELKNTIAKFEKEKAGSLKNDLLKQAEITPAYSLVVAKINLDSPAAVKDLIFELNKKLENGIVALGAAFGGKANLWIMINKKLVQEYSLDAGMMIREISKHILGGGGGQPFFATAGGSKPDGINRALEQAKLIIRQKTGQ